MHLQEVAGHATAMETVFAHSESIDLTENHIRQLQRDLLNYSSTEQRPRGACKTLANHIEAFGPDGTSLWPYSWLKSVIEQSKDAYYLALRRTQGKIRAPKPDGQHWVMYFLTALKQPKDRLE